VLTEAGLYRLVFKSTKPEAEAVKRWLSHDVLPALRRKGYYIMGEEREPAPSGAITKADVLGALGVTAGQLRGEIAQVAADVRSEIPAAVDAKVGPLAQEVIELRQRVIRSEEAKRQEALGLEMGSECEDKLSAVRQDFGLLVQERLGMAVSWTKAAGKLNIRLRSKCGVRGNNRPWRDCPRTAYDRAVKELPDLMVFIASLYGVTMTPGDAVAMVRNRTDPPKPLCEVIDLRTAKQEM